MGWEFAERTGLFPKEMFDNIRNSKCPICSKDIDVGTEFRNSTSKKEYEVSGMCQECQDSAFGVN